MAQSHCTQLVHMSIIKQRVKNLLAEADVRINGDRPWDIQVHNEHFYKRALLQGSLGVGESYMDGWWDAEDLDDLLTRLYNARLDRRVGGLETLWNGLRARVLNLQSRHRSFTVGERHYDLGNDLYEAMLGKRLVYSCASWKETHTSASLSTGLDAAQEAKLDLVCQKLGLESGMRVLDIGCGWGESLKFAHERYGVEGVGVTVSKQQATYAKKLCEGMPIEIRLQDYRELNESFDHIFSIGMFEHVGVKNYRDYFNVARRCLKKEGLFLLHSIGSNKSEKHTDPWTARYIFPNSMLPSATQITRALEGLFVIEDWHVLGTDYDRTLQAWRDNFDRAWPTLRNRYDDRFCRMWHFWLAGAMATFRSRRAQVWQLVLSPKGLRTRYVAPR